MVKYSKVSRWFLQMVSDDDYIRLQLDQNRKVIILSSVTLLSNAQLTKIVHMLQQGYDTEKDLNSLALKIALFLMEEDEFKNQNIGITARHEVSPKGKSSLRIEICEEEYM